MRVAGSDEGTHWHECETCGQPADPLPQLLPCPFCGGTPEDWGISAHNFACGGGTSCPASRPRFGHDSLAEAVAAWNQRYAPRFDEAEFARLTERGAKAWADVPNASDWVEDIRGNSVESETPNA